MLGTVLDADSERKKLPSYPSGMVMGPCQLAKNREKLLTNI